jgi:transposase-like protein
LLIDAIVVKVRDSQVANRPVYVAIGVNLDGERDVLGLWLGPTGGEGAKQWMSMLSELRNRGLQDALIVCCDGLKGLPEAIRVTWPAATVQTCVVHYAEARVMPSRVAEACGGGRIGLVEVGIIRALRGRRGVCLVAGSGRVVCREGWFWRARLP